MYCGDMRGVYMVLNNTLLKNMVYKYVNNEKYYHKILKF